MAAVDGRVKRLALNEPHRVKEPAGRGLSNPVNGDHTGVVQAAGDLRLQLQPFPTFAHVGQFPADELDRHRAVQTFVRRQTDDSESAPRP